MVRLDGLSVRWLGYATARLAGDDAIVYTDPGRYGVLTGEWEREYGDREHPSGGPYDAQDGDIVVVTHDHHYDDDGIERVAGEDATIVVYEGVSAEGVRENSGRDVRDPESLPYDVRRVAYGDELAIDGVEIEVTRAFNHPDGKNATDGEPLHPEGLGCGFVVTIDGVPCFWPGDSDVIDDHYDFDVSVFLPSIATNFTMDRHDAADLAEALDAEAVLPIHYNTFGDLESDSAAFAADVAKRGIPVVLDEGGF
ncbi:MBL fold metallo-hydrolase [Halosolutus gelatinilyticus]|uniref:MBL fold metallo-hydrolase n=1 Tax=Halosolutus gelatinilyticus TaxID=2931975 RepID=UPI001FF54037|nr:MBL fold metallo-hydrolase [Halosolutus gelatinilyticus]